MTAVDESRSATPRSDVSGEAGWVFNIQRFSIHDGPGIRTTVFLKGCPLRCLWCHNPEGLERRPQIRLAPALCTHCGRCMAVCEHGGHEVDAEKHALHMDRCVRCGRCVEACPAGALDLVGSRMTADAVMAVVRRDVPFYEQSGGGMTLSGGEPMAQASFSERLLSMARAEAIGTAVETSAYGPWSRLERLLPLVDLWLVDIKHTSDARHRELTGVSNATILRNIRRLRASGAGMTLRVPLIPSHNAEDAFLRGLIRFLRSLTPPPPVEIMPYHRLGLGKWESLGGVSPIPADIPAAGPEHVQPWVDALRTHGFHVEVT